MSRKQATPIRTERRGYFGGSVGPGAVAPTAAPASTTTTGVDIESRKPILPSIPVSGMSEAFRAHGVSDPVAAADYLSQEYLSETGHLEIPPPMWEPAPEMATKALLYGSRDLYEIDTDSTQELFAHDTIYEAVTDIESRFPGSHDCAHSILFSRLTYVDAFDSRPVHPEGKYSLVSHEFMWRMDSDSLTYEPGPPTTVGEVDEMITREDKCLRSVRDVGVASSLRGDVSLHSGTWAFDHERLTDEAMTAEMDADTRYQLLAVIYSDGASTNAGFDSVWSPGKTAPQPGSKVSNWVQSQGFDTDWYAFGSWASEESAQQG